MTSRKSAGPGLPMKLGTLAGRKLAPELAEPGAAVDPCGGLGSGG